MSEEAHRAGGKRSAVHGYVRSTREEMRRRFAARAGAWDMVDRRRRRHRRGRRDRRGQPRLRRPAAGAERLRQGHVQPQHQTGARRRALPGTGQSRAGDGGAARSAACCCRTRRTWCSNLAFVVPSYDWWEAPFYGARAEALQPARRQVRLRPVRHPLARGNARSGCRRSAPRACAAASSTTTASSTIRAC